jgi:hypothetical protein
MGKIHLDFHKKWRARGLGFLHNLPLQERVQGLVNQMYWRGEMSAAAGIKDEIKLSGQSVP